MMLAKYQVNGLVFEGGGGGGSFSEVDESDMGVGGLLLSFFSSGGFLFGAIWSHRMECNVIPAGGF